MAVDKNEVLQLELNKTKAEEKTLQGVGKRKAIIIYWYAGFINKHPFLSSLLLSSIMIFFSVIGFLSRDFPDFRDPEKGVFARHTDISGPLIAHDEHFFYAKQDDIFDDHPRNSRRLEEIDAKQKYADENEVSVNLPTTLMQKPSLHSGRLTQVCYCQAISFTGADQNIRRPEQVYFRILIPTIQLA